MDFQGSHSFAAPPQRVWSALTDPSVLQQCIPGAREVKFVNNNSAIEATIEISLAGLGGVFTGDAQIVHQTPPSQIVLSIDRTGSYGTLKGQATINLAAEGTGTNLTYSAHIDRSGRIGMVPDMIAQPAAKAGLGQFFKNLESKIK
jgi:carbon monoxide dehydrogenase subunit G